MRRRGMRRERGSRQQERPPTPPGFSAPCSVFFSFFPIPILLLPPPPPPPLLLILLGHGTHSRPRSCAPCERREVGRGEPGCLRRCPREVALFQRRRRRQRFSSPSPSTSTSTSSERRLKQRPPLCCARGSTEDLMREAASHRGGDSGRRPRRRHQEDDPAAVCGDPGAVRREQVGDPPQARRGGRRDSDPGDDPGVERRCEPSRPRGGARRRSRRGGGGAFGEERLRGEVVDVSQEQDGGRVGVRRVEGRGERRRGAPDAAAASIRSSACSLPGRGQGLSLVPDDFKPQRRGRGSRRRRSPRAGATDKQQRCSDSDAGGAVVERRGQGPSHGSPGTREQRSQAREAWGHPGGPASKCVVSQREEREGRRIRRRRFFLFFLFLFLFLFFFFGGGRSGSAGDEAPNSDGHCPGAGLA